MSFSLRFKIIVSTVTILVFAVGATIAASSYTFAQEYTAALQARTVIIGQSIKSQLDRLLDLGIPLDELTGFEQQLQDTVNRYDDIAYAMIIDLDGRVLFHNDPTQQKTNISDVTTLNAVQGGEEVIQTYSNQEGDYQDIFIPISDRNGSHIGAIRVGFPTSLITDKINQLAVLSGAIAVGSLMVAVALLIFTLSVWVTRPLGQLLTAIQHIQSGEHSLRTGVEIDSSDELGELSSAFNMMAAQLNDLIETLEQQVAERTQRIEAVAAISEKLVAILNLEQLLHELVDRIQDIFGYYHARVYLVDEQNQSLIVAAGTGGAGAQMKAEAHSVPLNSVNSLVARAARGGHIVRVDNIRETPDWLPNPQLPDTYAEMAVPILVDDAVAGVLNVQQNQIAGLDEADEQVMRSLANQVAAAVRNARLFDQVETALTETREVQARYVIKAWTDIHHQGVRHTYRRPNAVQPSSQLQNRLKHQAPGLKGISSIRTAEGADPALSAPVSVNDRSIGALQLYRTNSDQDWTEEEMALVEAIVDQVGQSAENLRLFEESQRRASREQTIRQVTDKLRTAPNLDRLLEIATTEISQLFPVAHAELSLSMEEQADLGRGDAGNKILVTTNENSGDQEASDV